MRGALDLLQFVLWAEGFLCLLGVPALVRIAWLQNGQVTWWSYELLYAIALAAVAPVVAWGVHRRQRWAWVAAIVHGLLQLPVLPFLSPIGVLELLVFAMPSARLEMTERAVAGPPVCWRRAVAATAGLLLTAFGIWAGSRFFAAHELPAWRWGALIAMLPLLALADLVIHEAGHIVAAWCVGMRLERVCLGPLLARRVDGGWAFSVRRRVSRGAGCVLATPRSAKRVRLDLILFFAGGPAASFALSATCLCAFVTSPGAAWAAWAQPIGLLAVWSALGFVLNSTPVRWSTTASDGFWIGELAKGSATGLRLCAHYAMAAAESGGTPPARWNPRWISQATAVKDGSADHLAGLLHAYRHHLDDGAVALAGRILDEAVTLQTRLPANYATRSLWLERAYYLAAHRKDAVNAEAAWERAVGGWPVAAGLRERARQAIDGMREAPAEAAEARGEAAGSPLAAAEQPLS